MWDFCLLSHQEHCKESLRKYGKTFSELHHWMDEPSTLLGKGHRVHRHDPPCIKCNCASQVLRTKNLANKSFNSALKSSSTTPYVAIRIFLPRYGFWFTVGFPSIVCNSYWRIAGGHRNYVCCCLFFGDSLILLLGLFM